jgi:hypothetical protein
VKVSYPALRTIHLLCGAFSLPALVMYGVSAVQMAHSTWFDMKPRVTQAAVQAAPNQTDGRAVGREAMAVAGMRGEITSIQETPAGFAIRIAVPGTVHELRYDRATGSVGVKTSRARVMGMLNRLHHAAGLWHEYGPVRMWAVLVAVVSAATVGLGVTGLWMWWIRRQERTSGLVLLAANLLFAVVILWRLRSSGP